MSNIIYISKHNDAETVEVEFTYSMKKVMFSRSCRDTIKQFLQRCQIKLSGPKKKKQSKSTENEPTESFDCCFLSSDNMNLNENLLLEKVILDNSNKFRVNDTIYALIINLPKVLSASVSNHAMATYVIQPTIEMEFSTHYECSWFVEIEAQKFSLVCHQPVYEPPVQFVNKRFKIEITPYFENRRGESITIHGKEPFQAPVGETPLTVRQQLVRVTSRNVECDFRVVSYNILADCYVFTDFALTTMYPQCPKYVLPMEYRKQILYREFLDYNADILGLQEVEDKFYHNELVPFMRLYGLKGVYSTQNARRSDGEAVFYKQDMFELMESGTVSMNEYCYESDILTSFLAVCSKDLRDDFLCRSTTFQYCVLKLKEKSKYVIVANTHLAAKHNFDAVRLLQTATLAHFIMRKTEDLFAMLEIESGDLGIFMLGDMNSSPCAFATRYMHSEVLDIEELDPLSAGTEFKLSLPPVLSMLESCYPKWSIEFTNMVYNFHSTLDWIYFNSDNLKCVNRLPMPSLESVATFGGLPNIGMASDHLALVADFAFK